MSVFYVQGKKLSTVLYKVIEHESNLELTKMNILFLCSLVARRPEVLFDSKFLFGHMAPSFLPDEIVFCQFYLL